MNLRRFNQLMNLRRFNQLSALRCALARDELEEAAALAAQVNECDFETLYGPRTRFRVYGDGGPRQEIEVAPESWPDLVITTEQFAAIQGGREFDETTWSAFAVNFAISPDHRALFADNATELESLDWPALFKRGLEDTMWTLTNAQGLRRMEIYLQVRGRELLEAIPIATYATVRGDSTDLIQIINNTFGAAGLEWFALEVVRFMVLPKTPVVRRTYAAELLKEITALYPRLAIDINVELEP